MSILKYTCLWMPFKDLANKHQAHVFFYLRPLLDAVYDKLRTCWYIHVYDAIHAFRVCFSDDVTITESTGIISICKYAMRHV